MTIRFVNEKRVSRLIWAYELHAHSLLKSTDLLFATGEGHGLENTPTQYMYRNPGKPDHLDLCGMPVFTRCPHLPARKSALTRNPLYTYRLIVLRHRNNSIRVESLTLPRGNHRSLQNPSRGHRYANISWSISGHAEFFSHTLGLEIH